MGDWQQDDLVPPVDDLLRSIPQGEAALAQGVAAPIQGRLRAADFHFMDRDQSQRLAKGIDAVFGTEVAAQYPGWPSGSTTDGASVDICFRSGPRSLEVVGLMYIDFGGEVFPFRALIERTESLISLDGFIGQVDDRTGHPPRLPAGTLINPAGGGDQSAPAPELILGRRALPIVWTKVLSWAAETGPGVR